MDYLFHRKDLLPLERLVRVDGFANRLLVPVPILTFVLVTLAMVSTLLIRYRRFP